VQRDQEQHSQAGVCQFPDSQLLSEQTDRGTDRESEEEGKECLKGEHDPSCTCGRMSCTEGRKERGDTMAQLPLLRGESPTEQYLPNLLGRGLQVCLECVRCKNGGKQAEKKSWVVKCVKSVSGVKMAGNRQRKSLGLCP
jgi:hypothetical protein